MPDACCTILSCGLHCQCSTHRHKWCDKLLQHQLTWVRLKSNLCGYGASTGPGLHPLSSLARPTALFSVTSGLNSSCIVVSGTLAGRQQYMLLDCNQGKYSETPVSAYHCVAGDNQHLPGAPAKHLDGGVLCQFVRWLCASQESDKVLTWRCAQSFDSTEAHLQKDAAEGVGVRCC